MSGVRRSVIQGCNAGATSGPRLREGSVTQGVKALDAFLHLKKGFSFAATQAELWYAAPSAPACIMSDKGQQGYGSVHANAPFSRRGSCPGSGRIRCRPGWADSQTWHSGTLNARRTLAKPRPCASHGLPSRPFYPHLFWTMANYQGYGSTYANAPSSRRGSCPGSGRIWYRPGWGGSQRSSPCHHLGRHRSG
jgi:hypothetical protein